MVHPFHEHRALNWVAITVSESGVELVIYRGTKNYTTTVKDDLHRPQR